MTSGPQPGDRVWIIDVSNTIHRLFHAIPEQVSPSGEPVNAVVGWVRTLRRLRRDERARWILPVFDGKGRGWRSEIYPEYKAGRLEQDAALLSQWPIVVRVTMAMLLPPLAVRTVEADDLIAAYTEALVKRGCEAVIASNDKDLLQLVRGETVGPGSVRQLAKARGAFELRGPDEVRAKFGVGPELVGDLLALAGDKTDGIPGVRDIGLKTAADLLREHGSLDQILDRWQLVSGRPGKLIEKGLDSARLSRRLVALRADTPLPVALDDLGPIRPSHERLNSVFRPLGYPRWEAAVDAYAEGRT